MRIAVLVPYRPDGAHRDRLWNYLSTHYWPQFGWPVLLGAHEGGRFNRSAALNTAAAQTDWDLAVIADSDTWVPRHQLEAAISSAAATGRLASALSGVVELGPDCTEAILTGTLSIDTLAVGAVRTDDLATQSSMLAITRTLWDNIGGFDEGFAGGWGGEDNAFWRAATILSGAPTRAPGFALHLWHKPAAPDDYKQTDPGYRANLARWNRYRVARTPAHLRQAQR